MKKTEKIIGLLLLALVLLAAGNTAKAAEVTCEFCGTKLEGKYENDNNKYDTDVYIPLIAEMKCPKCSSSKKTAVRERGHWTHNASQHNPIGLLVDATCEHDEYALFICADNLETGFKGCGAEYPIYHEGTKLPHDPGDWQTVSTATCESSGKEVRLCRNCGEECDRRSTGPLGHNYTDWGLVSQVTNDRVGEEQCICKRCGDRQTRKVYPDGTVMADEESLAFLAAAFMLGKLGLPVENPSTSWSSGLEAAVNAYLAGKELETCEGCLLPGTLSRLTADYLLKRIDFETLQKGYLLTDEETGLDVSVSAGSGCDSNGDGTHHVVEFLYGLLFEKDGESLRVKCYYEAQRKLADYDEACGLLNETHSCGRCGYVGLAEEATDFPVDLLDCIEWDNFAELSPEPGNLPCIQNIRAKKSPLGLLWDEFPGAAKYCVNYYMDKGEGSELVQEDTSKECDYIVPGLVGFGDYVLRIWAVDENGTPISGVSRLAGRICSTGNLAAPVISYKDGMFGWDAAACDNAVYQVSLFAQDIYGKWNSVYGGMQTEPSFDALQILQNYSYGLFDLVVQAKDPGEFQGDSPEAHHELEWRCFPVYKTLSPVNVRSGPGTEYARIGGIKSGEFYAAFEERDGFIRIRYQGEEGWAMKSAMKLTVGKRYTLTLVNSFNDAQAITVETTYDGRFPFLDSGLEYFRKRFSNGTLKGWSTERYGEANVDETLRFTENTTLYTVYDGADGSAVTVIYLLEDGSVFRTLDQPRGSCFVDDVQISDTECVNWYWADTVKCTGRFTVDTDMTVKAKPFIWSDGYMSYGTGYGEVSEDASLRKIDYVDGNQVAVIDHDDALLLENGRKILYNENYSVKDSTGKPCWLVKDPASGRIGYVRKHYIRFSSPRLILDPNGGFCSAAAVSASCMHQGANSEGYFVASLPTPVRYVESGELKGQPYIFRGWYEDGTGDYVDQYTAFWKSTRLVAGWLEPNPEFTPYKAIIMPGASLYSKASGGKEISELFASVQEVLVLRERGSKCLILYKGQEHYIGKEDVVTDYGTYTVPEGGAVLLFSQPKDKGFEDVLDATFVPVTVYVIETKGDWSKILFVTEQPGHSKCRIIHNNSGTPLSEDTVTYAIWSMAWVKNKEIVPKVTVTFDYNDGTGRTAERQVDRSGGFFYSGIVAPKEVSSSSDFIGWFTERDTGERVNLTGSFSRNVTVYAHYHSNAASYYAVENKNGTKLYGLKDLSAPQTTLARGTAVIVLEDLGDDCLRVRVADTQKRGYVHKSDLVKTRVINLDIPAGKEVKVYSGPSEKNKKLGTLTGKAVVLSAAYADGFRRIVYDTDGKYANGFAYITQGAVALYK